MSFHLNTNPGILLRNITIETQTACYFIELYMKIFKEGVILLLILSTILIINFKTSALILLVFGSISFLFFYFIKSESQKRGNLNLKHKGEKLKSLNSTLHSIKEIKINFAELFAMKSFNNEYEQEERHRRWSSFISQLPRIYLK